MTTGMFVVLAVAAPFGVASSARAAAPGPAVPPDDATPGEYIVMLRPSDGVRAPRETAAADLSSRVAAVMARLDDSAEAARGGAAAADSSTDDPAVAELPIIDGFAARLSAGEAAVLHTFDDVVSVEPNLVVENTERASTGPDELPWGLDRIDQMRLPLDGSYTPPGDGSGVTAYVIDDGVWAEHREFGGRVKPMVDFVGDAPSPDQVDPACMPHGTHVAGTIAGANVGVAPRATVQPVRVLGCGNRGYLTDVLRGMDWVAQHASFPAVVNMSLGNIKSLAAETAVRYLTAKGITVVVAAGNDSADACAFSPASAPSAITVGATTLEDRPASYSNMGPCVDLYAPGSYVVSASIQGPNRYAAMGGTSMASPHVAGAAVLYLAAHPGATPDAVERALVNGAAADVLGQVPPSTPNRLLQVNGLRNPVNRPDTDPVAYITPPPGVGPIAIGTSITLDGRRSFDPDGGALTYEWRVQGRTGVAGTRSTLRTIVGAVGLFEVTLKVTNASGASATATMQIVADDPNPPVIVLDPPSNLLLAARGEEVTLDASDSYDVDGGDLSIEWFYRSPYGATEAIGPTFTHTFEGDYAEVYVIATNEFGAVDTTQVLITEPYSPEAIVEPSVVNVTVGEAVLFDGSQSYDRNGPAGDLGYAWRDSPDGEPVSNGPTYTRFFDKVGTFDVYLTVYSLSGEESTVTATAIVTPRPSPMAAIDPVRVLDTRASSPGVPGPKGALRAAGVVRFTVGDIPLSAAGVVLNVTAVNPAGDGHLTVYPCGERPETSNVNYRSGVTTANAVVSSLGDQHQLCVWSFAPTDVVVDVTGYVPAESPAHTIDPVRVIDTRAELGEGTRRVPAGGVLRVPVESVAGVPADAAAVLVNVTAANPAGDGHLTVYPCGAAPPTSNVNYRAGTTKANMAVVQLAKNGSLCVKSHAETDVIVDVFGLVDPGAPVQLGSARMLDTRDSALGAAPGQRGPVGAGASVRVNLGVDATRTAGVFVNVAAANPSDDGHLTVFPCGTRPTASVLNYGAGVTTSNMVFSKVDSTGSICVWTHAMTDLVVDYVGSVTGYR